MKKTTLFLLALAFPVGAYAAELNGVSAADIKNEEVTLNIVRTFPVDRSAGAADAACPKTLPACAKVGEDVRIPAECCSGKAEPNQNGEMTCVAAKPPVVIHCAKVGEDVRIPAECCSKTAEPNQNGEMTCVAAPVPSCAAVGDDVRIPAECCSKKAEPNQNGEMTCVAARAARSPFSR